MKSASDAGAEKVVPAQVHVSRQFRRATGTKDEADSEVVSVHRFITNPAQVGVEFGLTLNTGNFESVRISVSVSVPCYKEETEAAFLWAKDFVEERIKSEVAEVRAQKTPAPF